MTQSPSHNLTLYRDPVHQTKECLCLEEGIGDVGVNIKYQTLVTLYLKHCIQSFYSNIT